MMHQGGGKSGGLGYPSTRSRQTSATSAADSHPRASSDDQSETAQWSRQISFADSHPDASSDDQSETTQFSRQTSPTAPQPWASADGQYGTGELGSGGQGDDVAGRPKRRLVVRNTFLTVVDDEEAPTLGRVKSAPTLALCPSMGLARTGAGVHVAPSSGRR
ncbi:unnamed protein product [Prorocentrum cordatum]|uniref:Uncharacterized protein n=1 Tax=Prorocentrum cordatum TaxID=2364126 RepID=A0ABN9WBH4_9DINO|nr:unnamed protein product [Polarella glacialis]